MWSVVRQGEKFNGVRFCRLLTLMGVPTGLVSELNSYLEQIPDALQLHIEISTNKKICIRRLVHERSCMDIAKCVRTTCPIFGSFAHFLSSSEELWGNQKS